MFKKQKEISKKINATFDNLKIKEGSIYNHPGDKTGKSKKRYRDNIFKNIRNNCNRLCRLVKKITKEKQWIDNLGVGIFKEYENWLRYEAFK